VSDLLVNAEFYNMPTDIRVAIFEDNYLLRDSYYQLINGTPGYTCVGAYDNAEDLIFKIKRSEPDVILMDIEMPGINGIKAVRIIKNDFPHIHAVMQTVFEDDEKIFAAILAGASGYILKKTPPAKILEAIAEVYNGGAPMTPGVAAKALELFRKGIKPLPDEEEGTLNERQKEILESILKGMSYKLIAEKLFISVDTVRYHVKNIYEKLQVHSKYELMRKQGK
jgi:DNA-binding NarL/FixJ family response regulator